ncbi:unnamed protein product [Closterium sp. Naga37s-1]|nr:unnamed protein product [Closterium sp. Naga37s-1]
MAAAGPRVSHARPLLCWQEPRSRATSSLVDDFRVSAAWRFAAPLVLAADLHPFPPGPSLSLTPSCSSTPQPPLLLSSPPLPTLLPVMAHTTVPTLTNPNEHARCSMIDRSLSAQLNPVPVILPSPSVPNPYPLPSPAYPLHPPCLSPASPPPPTLPLTLPPSSPFPSPASPCLPPGSAGAGGVRCSMGLVTLRVAGGRRV